MLIQVYLKECLFWSYPKIWTAKEQFERAPVLNLTHDVPQLLRTRRFKVYSINSLGLLMPLAPGTIPNYIKGHLLYIIFHWRRNVVATWDSRGLNQCRKDTWQTSRATWLFFVEIESLLWHLAQWGNYRYLDLADPRVAIHKRRGQKGLRFTGHQVFRPTYTSGSVGPNAGALILTIIHRPVKNITNSYPWVCAYPPPPDDGDILH
jgi:hypothetical protein